MTAKASDLRLIAWEATRACGFSCRHCRAAAQPQPQSGELTTAQITGILDTVARHAKPILILTGGDPLLREDIFSVARHAVNLGFTVVMSPAGSRITTQTLRQIQASGIHKISLSLDGSKASVHDRFRQVKGAFAQVLDNCSRLKARSIPFQINTTVSPHNAQDLEALYQTVIKSGASNWDIFMLVPSGRGRDLQSFTPHSYAQVLTWIAGKKSGSALPIKVTCSPQYAAVTGDFSAKPGKGCMAGKAFCFISSTGELQGCGYLPLSAGNLKTASFWELYLNNPFFNRLQDESLLQGKCGYCEYKKRCGGCRARAYGITGDFLESEPMCGHIPGLNLDKTDRELLNLLQKDFPLVAQPFAALGARLNLTESAVIAKVTDFKARGLIRHIGPVWSVPELKYQSLLAAMAVPSEKLESIARQLNTYPEVTHNYSRDHYYNLWFTLTVPSHARLQGIIADIKSCSGIEEIILLPATQKFKSEVIFEF